MIQINKSWFIDADKYCYILFKKIKRVNRNTGEEEDAKANVTFHPTVSDALTCFMRNMQRKFVSKNDVELQEAIEEFRRIESFVIETIDKKKI